MPPAPSALPAPALPAELAQPADEETITNFISIEVHGDQAIAVVDIGYRTDQLTLVKVAGSWYIAGCKTLVTHG
jgi:hypothetical protein